MHRPSSASLARTGISVRVARVGALVAASALVALLVIVEPAAAADVVVTATGDASTPTALTPPDRTLRDLGISTHLSDGRRLWVFGDTFEPGASRHSAIHPNTAALAEPGEPGVVHDAIDATGHRSTFVPLDATEASFNHGQRFRAVPPQRVYDSRASPGTALGPDQSREIVFPVPSDITGPVSAVFNLTAINVGGVATDLEVTEPTAAAPPTTSSLNLGGHETAANLVTAALGPPANNVFSQPDRVRIRNSASSVELIVDVVGFTSSTPADEPFVPAGPTRLFDSTDCGPRRNLTAGEQITLTVRGSSCLSPGAVPAGVTAVVVNLTADGPGSPGPTHLTAWAAGTEMPPTSNVNLAARDVRANLAIVPVSPDGEISLYNSGGSVRVVVDLFGYFAPSSPSPAGSQFVPTTPARACDTRSATTGCGSGLGAQTSRTISLPPALIPEGASAALLNVTMVGPSESTHLTVWGSGLRPLASNLNGPPGAVRAAQVAVPVAADGTISVFNNAGSVDVIVDVVGFYATMAATVGSCPAGSRPRLATWPTSVVTVSGAPPPATDRVAVYYARWVICSSWAFLAQDVGVALYDYTAGQPLDRPMRARRPTVALATSADGSFPAGAHIEGGHTKDGFVYLFGCTTTANVCYLRRASTGSDLTRAANYEYYASSGGPSGAPPVWGSAAAQQPVGFLPIGPIPHSQFPASDLSVQWMPDVGPSGALVMMYEPRWDSGAQPVIVRTASEPWGMWSAPVTKQGGGQPAVPGCDNTSLATLCRAFHLNPDASTGAQLWFSFYATAAGKVEWASLPIAVS